MIQYFDTKKCWGDSKNMPKRKEMKTTANRQSDEDPQPLRSPTFSTTLQALRSV
jgi:hypothetical protein